VSLLLSIQRLPDHGINPPKAFSIFRTKTLRIQHGGEIQNGAPEFRIPMNLTNFLWELEAADFIECNKSRLQEFSEKVQNDKLVTLTDPVKIERAMKLIIGRID
jgi:hypothetical protein